MGFLDGYEPVEARLERFWRDHPIPEGQVGTEFVKPETIGLDPAIVGPCVVCVAKVYVNDGVVASGWAHEVPTAKGVNSTSFLENCETSAIGRALANAGYAPKAARPSREEMTKAQRRPSCVKCGQMIEQGAGIKAGSEFWHKTCRQASRPDDVGGGAGTVREVQDASPADPAVVAPAGSATPTVRRAPKGQQ